MATNRPPYFLTFTGRNGTQGPVTVTGGGSATVPAVGDIVAGVFNVTGTVVVAPAGVFEQVASVAGQLQQMSTGNLSGNTYLVLMIPQGWASIQN